MDFLDKLYESEFFGIGLFIVISFLVVLFLIVLFFGKKDEKKRKMASEESPSIPETNNELAFKETSEPITLDIPTNNLETVEPIQPINYDIPADNINMNEEINPINIEPVQPVVEKEFNFEPVSEIPINNNANTYVSPIIEPTPVIESTPEIRPIIPEPVASPIIEPVRPIVEPNITEPIIKEEPTLINIPVQEVTKVEPVFEQPVEPVVKAEPIPEVRNTSIDFDALADSISKELDALEQSVKVTPLEEAIKPTNQFSSVYVSTPTEPVAKPEPVVEPKVVEPTRIDIAPKSSGIELPKKVEMPAMKSSEPINIQVSDIAEGESYTI